MSFVIYSLGFVSVAANVYFAYPYLQRVWASGRNEIAALHADLDKIIKRANSIASMARTDAAAADLALAKATTTLEHASNLAVNIASAKANPAQTGGK